MGNKSKVKKSDSIELDEKTQGNLKAIVQGANQQIAQIQAQAQASLGLIVTSYVNAKGQEGEYIVSKDFTKLEKQTQQIDK